ncbi:tail fiber domain-containing protein [Candidatus Kaiserbacteria bacterium]|nr:tail fiber domain-containing protein [Candidatus Kaiserbacteria bacterium]
MSIRSDAALHLGANGTIDVTINTSGNVGIGTTSPQDKLDVSDGDIRLSETSNNSYSQILHIDGDGSLSLSADAGNTLGGSEIRFLVDGSEHARIDSSGNVGVGTTNPGGTLPTGATAGAKVLEVSSNSGTLDSAISLSGNNSITGTDIWFDRGTASTYIDNRYDTTAGNIYFRTRTAGTPVTALTVLGSGNVGIGTDGPEQPFHVYVDSGDANTPVLIEQDGAGDAKIGFELTGLTTWSAGIDNTDDTFKIANSTNLGSNTYLAIIGGGNIGIGTTSPSQLLHLEEDSGSAGLTIEGEDFATLYIKADSNNESTADSSIRYYVDNAEQFRMGVDASDSNKFKISDGSALGTNDWLTIDTSGNVGIGETSPSATLHISSDSSYPTLRLEDSGSGQYAEIFTNNDDLYIGSDEGNAGGASSIRFRVDSTEYMQINSSGNVGIGETSPAGVLEVNNAVSGNSSTLLTLTDAEIGGGAHTQILFTRSGSAVGDTTVGYINSASNDLIVNATDDLFLQAAGSDVLSLTNDGNVGIGTTTPQEKLHISGASGAATLLLQRSNAHAVGNAFGDIDFQDYLGNVTARILASANTDDVDGTDIKFSVTNDGGSLTERMRITADGLVGIGTTDPENTLEVESSSTGTLAVGTSANLTAGGTSGTLKFYSRGFGADDTLSAQIRALLPAGDSDDSHTNLAFYTSNGGLTEKLRITNTGNVGIGTTTPNSVLHVAETGTGHGMGGIISSTVSANGNAGYRFVTNGADRWGITTVGTDGANLRFYDGNNSATRMTIDSSGNVGIGTTSPSFKLDIDVGNSNQAINLQSTDSYAFIEANDSSGYSRWGTGPDGFFVAVNNTDTGDLVINSSGQLLVGYNSSVGAALGLQGALQVTGTNGSSSSININRFSDNAFGGYLALTKSRGTLGLSTIVQDDDVLGYITFAGADGTNLNTEAASIRALVDGTPGEDDIPGRLVFSTTPDGSNSAVDRMVIDSSGDISVGTTTASARLNVQTNSTKDILNLFETGGAEVLTVTEAGNVGIGATSPDNPLHIQYSDATAIGSLGTNDPIGLQIENTNSAGVADIMFRTSDADGHISYVDTGTNSGDFYFTTDDGGSANQALVIKSSGRVGIGTTNPAASKLLVASNGSSDHVLNITADDNRGASRYALQVLDSDTNARGSVYISTATGVGLTVDGASTGYSAIFNNGNVGIGATSPSELLELRRDNDGGDSSLVIVNESATDSTDETAEIKFALANNLDRVAKIVVARENNFSSAGNADTSMRFFNSVNGTPTEQLTIANSGNVGIGETDPDTLLHLTSGSSFSPDIKIENTNADGNPSRLSLFKTSASQADGDELGQIRFMGLDSGGTATNFGYIQGSSEDITNTDEAGSLEFFMAVDGTARNFLKLNGYNGTVGEGEIVFNETSADIDFRVESDNEENALFVQGSTGNVGIGTTNPDTSLHVLLSDSATSGTASGFVLEHQTSGTAAAGFGTDLEFKGELSTGFTGAEMAKITALWEDANGGGTNDGALVFSTVLNNSYNERLRIDSSGNVGIGTTEPSGPLEVQGRASDSNAIHLVGRSADDISGIRWYDNGEATSSYVQGDGSWMRSWAPGGWHWSLSGAPDTSYAGYTFEGANVGIGTTTPTSRLVVQGTAGVDESLSLLDLVQDLSSGSSQNSAGIRIFGAGELSGRYAGIFAVEPTPSGGDLDLAFSTADASVNSEVMRLTATGNVGIGTTSPSTKLHVANSSGTTLIQTEVAANAIVGFDIKKTGSTNQEWRIADGISANGKLEFYDVTDSRSVMTFDGSGNVGIGTTDPGTKLQILGSGTAVGTDGVSSLIVQNSGAASTVAGISMVSGNNAVARLSFGDTDAQGIGTIEYLNSSDKMLLRTSATARMAIDSSGNVGIGTTTPVEKLEIFESAGSTPGYLAIGGETTDGLTGSDFGGIKFNHGAGNEVARIEAQRGASADTSGWLEFNTSLSGTMNRMMTITHEAIGIGDVNPGTLLTLKSTSPRIQMTDSDTNVDAYLNASSATGDFVIEVDRFNEGSAPNFIVSLSNTERLRIDDSGRVGIGTTSPVSTLSIQGSLCVRSTGSCGTTDGTIYATTGSISNIDVAENYPTIDATIAAGEIVTLDPYNNEYVKRASYGDTPFGIISTAPGITLGGEDTDGKPVALAGRVPVKVNGEGGAIAVGDRITLSLSEPGVGMRATESVRTIGIALEPYTATTTTASIMVAVENEYTFVSDEFALKSANTGFGTSSPYAKLSVVNETAGPSFIVEDSTGGDDTPFIVDADGKVGIGTSTPTAQLHTTGSVRFENFGAGALQTDADGNLTVSSDERLKDIHGDFDRGLEDIRDLEPILYSWNEFSGFETQTVYAGFSAQNVQESIPEAVGEDKYGFLTLADRPILAAAVNAIKELDLDLQSLADEETLFSEAEEGSFTARFLSNMIAWFADTANGIGSMIAGTFQATEQLCINDTCVSEEQLQQLLTGEAVSAEEEPVDTPDDEDDEETPSSGGGGGSDPEDDVATTTDDGTDTATTTDPGTDDTDTETEDDTATTTDPGTSDTDDTSSDESETVTEEEEITETVTETPEEETVEEEVVEEPEEEVVEEEPEPEPESEPEPEPEPEPTEEPTE